eukprot:GHVS01101732.1.p1 GENE.GHVS01101732.1~~GHVS01101732.1.p1  ORF type:complete len:201 (+),score=1.81 GHVS01101732.1:260-862(+)
MYEGQPDENILNQFESSLTRYLEVKVIQLARTEYVSVSIDWVYTERVSQIQRHRIKHLQDMIKLLKEHFLPEDLAVHIIDHLFNLQMRRRRAEEYILRFKELIEVIDPQAMSDLMERRLFERGLPKIVRFAIADGDLWLGGESTIVNLDKMILVTRQINCDSSAFFRSHKLNYQSYLTYLGPQSGHSYQSGKDKLPSSTR